MIVVVKRDVHSGFSSGVQQALSRGIFADRVRERGLLYAVVDLGPRLSVIASAEDVRLVVVEAVAIDGRVSDGCIEMRRLNLRNLAPVSESLRSHIRPLLSTGGRDVDQPGIASHPDQPG